MVALWLTPRTSPSISPSTIPCNRVCTQSAAQASPPRSPLQAPLDPEPVPRTPLSCPSPEAATCLHLAQVAKFKTSLALKPRILLQTFTQAKLLLQSTNLFASAPLYSLAVQRTALPRPGFSPLPDGGPAGLLVHSPHSGRPSPPVLLQVQTSRSQLSTAPCDCQPHHSAGTPGHNVPWILTQRLRTQSSQPSPPTSHPLPLSISHPGPPPAPAFAYGTVPKCWTPRTRKRGTPTSHQSAHGTVRGARLLVGHPTKHSSPETHEQPHPAQAHAGQDLNAAPGRVAASLSTFGRRDVFTSKARALVLWPYHSMHSPRLLRDAPHRPQQHSSRTQKPLHPTAKPHSLAPFLQVTRINLFMRRLRLIHPWRFRVSSSPGQVLFVCVCPDTTNRSVFCYGFAFLL